MRIVHLADLHIGYRQYQRLTPAGINQREADVAAAFTRTVDRVIALVPEVIIVAGDVFHQVRPANPAILHAFAQMARLVHALPEAIVIVIAGNHDTPRSRDTVCILRLFRQLGAYVVDGAPQQLRFEAQSLSVLCIPDTPRVDVQLTPDPTVRYNVLAAHAEVRGLLPEMEGRERASFKLEPEEVERDAWDYVALGHYHVHRKMGERAWYCGAIEYTSTNAWGELREEQAEGLPGKGMIEFDLEKRVHTFHHLPVLRGYADLPVINGLGLGAAELDARIAGIVDRCKGGIDDKVVRLVLRNVPRHVARDLNQKSLREFRQRALHFLLDVRPPEVTRTSASGAPGRGVSLADTLRGRLEARPLDSEIDRTRFVALGMEYLAKAEANGPLTAPEAETP